MSDLSAVLAAKVALRADLLARRRALDPAARATAALAVAQAVAALIQTRRPTTVAAYVPVGNEPGGPDLPQALLTACMDGTATLLLPVLRDDLDLDWARWSGEPLARASRGLRQPTGPLLGRHAIGHADLIITPALAADRVGHRLGRGGGSYDRALIRARPGVPIVALLHDGELLDRAPAEAHDRRVTAAVTPATGLVRLDGALGDDASLALG
ncbi:5-formyltetrahydrofolate cyclo-ligase [Pilimelia columellifera]|uniref:5-formyltetrahydrofolate cyclo-ligase n=1 Tax=Pilimelia columellifera subsp. columellifera TaxID=706583 RepID=A0ABP6AR00_9ACTN